ncbi:MAG: methyltransferase domain-containing protein [Bacteroidota bacterium]|nr:methyltransferase domain-containing protein [Bacteroidota bacterium]
MFEITDHDRKYWQYEYDVVAKHLLPLLKECGLNSNGETLLDVGCGDGGGVSAFYDAGFVCKGFDIETRRVELANAMRQERNFEMVYGNIYDEDFPYSKEQFDLIVLHDVFEHLGKKELVLEKLKSCLKSDGRILITFPPYYSAYGAHQQLLKSKMGKLPFFHLLPFSIPFLIDKFPNEEKSFVEEIKKLASLKMGIHKFEKLLERCGLSVEQVRKYIIGPNHIRFGLKPISAGWFGNIPILNEIVSSGIVYLLKNKN